MKAEAQYEPETYLQFAGTRLSKVCDIRAAAGESDSVGEYYPQKRFKNSRNLKLNRYGQGPFCKFKIANGLNKPGVYVISVRGSPQYVDECQNLSSRFNTGYGNISPRNCFVGGQETNCRINNLICRHSKQGDPIELYFTESSNHKDLERHLRKQEPLPWNLV